MKRAFFAALLTCTALSLVADDAWKSQVSASERARTNPLATNPDAARAGGHIFAEHCAKCHGADGQGHGSKPSLRTEEVQNASDGELFWMLKNGQVRHGMPSWSTLPEGQRWQVIAYVKSLHSAK
jgi:mono/diheme cytochrome c family protein